MAQHMVGVGRSVAARVGNGGHGGHGAFTGPGRLSARERDVLRLLADGRTDREIAATLFISRKTASNHVANILDKFMVGRRAAAVARAVQNGLV